MHYAYLDESGNTAPFQANECFLVVAVVAGSYGVSRYLAYQVRKLRQKARMPIGEELKASAATHRQRQKLLLDVAAEHVSIVAIILDKRYVRRPPSDPEEWYRETASLAAWHCAKRWPELTLTLDKRYSNPSLRARLEQAIRARIYGLEARVAIQQVDSRASPGLQVADLAAWSIGRKHEVGDRTYYNLIRDKVIVEEVVEAK